MADISFYIDHPQSWRKDPDFRDWLRPLIKEMWIYSGPTPQPYDPLWVNYTLVAEEEDFMMIKLRSDNRIIRREIMAPADYHSFDKFCESMARYHQSMAR